MTRRLGTGRLSCGQTEIFGTQQAGKLPAPAARRQLGLTGIATACQFWMEFGGSVACIWDGCLDEDLYVSIVSTG